MHDAHVACQNANRDAPIKCARPLDVPALQAAQDGAASSLDASAVRPAWIAPVHPSRYTLSQEALCVYLLGLAPINVIHEQIGLYHGEQYPMKERADSGGPGLLEGEWHFRDLRQPSATNIGNLWFSQFATWLKIHHRDQLSANYAIWKSGALDSKARASNGTFMYADYSTYLSTRPPPPKKAILLHGTRRDFWREHLHELSTKVKGRKLISKPFVHHTSECDWAQWGLSNFQSLQANRFFKSQQIANLTHEDRWAKQWVYSNFRKLKNIRQALGVAQDWF